MAFDQHPLRARVWTAMHLPARRVSLQGLVIGRPQLVRQHQLRRTQLQHQRRVASGAHVVVQPLRPLVNFVSVNRPRRLLPVDGCAVGVGSARNRQLPSWPKELDLLQLQIVPRGGNGSEDELDCRAERADGWDGRRRRRRPPGRGWGWRGHARRRRRSRCGGGGRWRGPWMGRKG